MTASCAPVARGRIDSHGFASSLLHLCNRESQVPVARSAIDSGGVVEIVPGTEGPAARRSWIRTWEYLPMVRVGVECLANSRTTLSDAPLDTIRLM